ncbi:Retrotransposon gag protein [Corchorus olitorius]|uniref:Retrotransposon gag protein n=1 Tax=Corchorus olitorius TaxID=93759 RepID=A0A1R3GB99_9ROSI|nr:Retrotransposon gag protein [Corchorus olitorius]
MLDFEKYEYDGTKNPRDHVLSFQNKMAPFSTDDKFLNYSFMFSLIGSAIKWYNQLDPRNIESWSGMTKAFLAHFRYLMDLAPTRDTLTNMSRRPDESLTAYGQRFREVAMLIPSLPKREVNSLFLRTLPKEYFKALLPKITESFSSLIEIEEAMEAAIKMGYLDEVSDYAKKVYKKKEGEVHLAGQADFRPKSQGQEYYPLPAGNYGYSYRPRGYYLQYQTSLDHTQYPRNVGAISGTPFQPKPQNQRPNSLWRSKERKIMWFLVQQVSLMLNCRKGHMTAHSGRLKLWKSFPKV